MSAVGSSAGIAQKGDLLEFLQNLTEESLLDDDVLLLKFHKKGSLNEDQSSNVGSNYVSTFSMTYFRNNPCYSFVFVS